MKYLVFFLAALSLTACGVQKRPAAPAEKPVELAGKSLAEVLSIKYNKAKLVCSLRLQYGKEMDFSVAPDDKVELDLAQENLEGKTFSLKAKAGDAVSEYTVKVDKVKVVGLTELRHSDKKTYKMNYSPVVDISYNYKNDVKVPSGSFGSNSKFQSSIYEKVLSTQKESYYVSADIAYHYAYQCTIDTDIKPLYQKQFSVTEVR